MAFHKLTVPFGAMSSCVAAICDISLSGERLINVRNADILIFFVEGFKKATETMLFVSWTAPYITVYDILFCALSDNQENMKIHRTLGRFYVHSRTCLFLS